MAEQKLSVTLPSDSLYVSGTVNGVATTWTNVEGNTWETVAERSPDDIYHVELTIINAAGTSVNASLTLFYGLLNLITDRTQADVNRVQELYSKFIRGTATDAERQEYMNGLRGAYNASDMNRVGAAVSYVAERFKSNGYVVEVTAKQDWQIGDIPQLPVLSEYLTDIANLRAVYNVASLPPVPDDMEKLTYQEANNIELILKMANDMIDRMIAAWIFSGEIYTGEDIKNER